MIKFLNLKIIPFYFDFGVGLEFAEHLFPVIDREYRFRI